MSSEDNVKRINTTPREVGHSGHPIPDKRKTEERASSGDSGTKSSRKPLSLAERQRRLQKRLAKKYPNGPEARALANAAPSMPATLTRTIELGPDRDLYQEAFTRAVDRMRAKARKGQKWYGRSVAKDFRDAYGLQLTEEEEAFVVEWANHLRDNREELHKGKFAPGADVLASLGVRSEDEAIFERIEALDRQDEPPVQHSASAQTESARIRSDDFKEAFADQSISTGRLSCISAISELPQAPREIPFSFTQLKSADAQTFWRAYWRSDDLTDLFRKGSSFAADPLAVKEVRALGAKAEAFLVKTMRKLGIPLS